MCVIADKKLEQMIEKAIKDGYIDKDLSPLKCGSCNSRNLDETIRSCINDISCEAEIVCVDCGETCGYWAYGGYDPYCLNCLE